MEKRWTRRAAIALAGSHRVGYCLFVAAFWDSELSPWPPMIRRKGSPERRRRLEGRLSSISMIEEAWKKAGVKPAKPAADDEFLRRAYLDLLGRIPNVQEARAFLQTRERDKRDKLVTYLLDHPDFAKNFATQWSVLLIGRGNQGRMVDRGFADELAAETIRFGSPMERGRP